MSNKNYSMKLKKTAFLIKLLSNYTNFFKKYNLLPEILTVLGQWSNKLLLSISRLTQKLLQKKKLVHFLLPCRRIQNLQTSMDRARLICVVQRHKRPSMDPIFHNCEYCATLLQHLQHLGGLDQYDLHDFIHPVNLSW